MKIFDAHFHIIEPQFPLVGNHGFMPANFTIEEYVGKLKGYELVGGTIVSGSFQAFEQEYLLSALQKLGKQFFGVANIPKSMPDTVLDRLDKAGVRAARFNLKRGGSEAVEHLEYLSSKLHHEFGWHTELYLDSKDLIELLPRLKCLPAFSIDHLGLSNLGLKQLYQSVESGARVKATGFGRLNFNPVPVMKRIMSINPESLLFGTDLPSTRAKIPFSITDIELVNNNFDKSDRDLILYKNALQWYN